ncbi:MAG: S41 family peptidase [Defluviitaleaceae bacterium]|nr:S41 family peptidase [Defluviitaleaceae bacterium]
MKCIFKQFKLLFVLLLLIACGSDTHNDLEYDKNDEIGNYIERFIKIDDMGRPTIPVELAKRDFLYLTDILRENLPVLDAHYNRNRAFSENFEEDFLHTYSRYNLLITVSDYMLVREHINMMNTFIRRLQGTDMSAGHLFVFDHTNILPMMLDYINSDYSREIYNLLGFVPEEIDENAPSGNVNFELFEEYSVAYINVRSFFTTEYDIYKVFDFYNEIADFDNLIIDLTNNLGGWLSWFDMFIFPNLSRVSSGGVLPLFFKDSELLKNHLSNFGLSYEPIENFDFERFSEIERSDFENLAYVIQNLYIQNDDTETLSFDGDIYILINRRSMSSSDAFARFVRATNFATLVGTPTGGGGEGVEYLFMIYNNFNFIDDGQPFTKIMELPYSRLLFRFDHLYSINEVGNWTLEIGTLPDIWQMEGKTILETALYHISQKREAN